MLATTAAAKRRIIFVVPVAGAVLSALAGGCGHTVQKLKNSTASHDERGGTADAKYVKIADQTANFRLTAAYAPVALDVLVIRETGAAFDTPEFAAKLKTAAQPFAARLLYADADVHIGFLDAGSQGDLLGASPSSAQFDRSRPDFRKSVETRLTEKLVLSAFRPLAALKGALDQSADAHSTTTGFFREGAFLAVVFLTRSDEAEDLVEPAEVTAALDQKIGVGNYAVSAIVPDAAGCGALAPPGHARKNAILNLVQSTGGLFVAACADSYTFFFDQLLAFGTKVTQFRLALPAAAVWPTLLVTAGGAVVKDWSYEPGAKEIWLPRLIPAGSTVHVSYEIDDGTRTEPAPTPEEQLGAVENFTH